VDPLVIYTVISLEALAQCMGVITFIKLL